MDKEKSSKIPRGNELNGSYYSGGWESSLMDQSHPFESALSSMVSSPTASYDNGGSFNGHNIVLKELIGRLGSICNSGEISPQQAYGGSSASASCYSTPLTSPKPSILENQWTRENSLLRGSFFSSPTSLAPVSSGRSAGLSCFANATDPDKNSRVPSPQSFKIYGSPTSKEEAGITARGRTMFTVGDDAGDSRENSSLSELIPANPRKRSACASKGKGKETPATATAKDANADMRQKQPRESSKPPEPPKDYIHVRARRGQATDAHSLAERVRREKISERMKILQDLVPGCNKVAGKAVMLDEIINYVQSLLFDLTFCWAQFLSMKLATVSPSNTDTLVIKDMCQSRGSLHRYIHPPEGYSFQANIHGAMPITGTMEGHFIPHSLDGVTGRNHKRQLLPMGIYSNETSSRVATFWDDLNSLVQMGLGEDESQ